LPRPLRQGVVGAAKLAGRLHTPWARRAEIAEAVAGGEELFWGGAICFRGQIKDDVWNGARSKPSTFPEFMPPTYGSYDSHAVVRELMDRFRRENPRADYYQGMLFLELRQRLPELLLMRVDKISMSTSVEARVPFLDQDLVAFGMKLPLHMRLRNGIGKYLLKKALRGLLPDEIIDRRKMGFGAPMREWLTGPFGDYARDRLLGSRTGLFDLAITRRLLDDHVEGRANWSFHLWVLLNYVMWHDHWIRSKRD
jgi:asparagine synthase (glutamine-hydrolysing)